MTYDAKEAWTKDILNMPTLAYPAEYVIRIFKGAYPRLNLDKNFRGRKICDIGCGDGRHIPFLHTCGFDAYGIELTEEIVDRVKENLRPARLPILDVRVGSNDRIPFGDVFFDYLLAWNTCYYLGEHADFAGYVKEYARILKKNGYLILSIPKKTCFIYHGSERIAGGRAIIRNDPFNIRNGEILRIFDDEEEIEEAFSGFFDRFVFASVHDDCFGYDYHWHLVVCQKR
ncbi:MAG: class I SAM-dependent methyltransferase [Methanoregula sp.]|jgi:SAM-dependent methyltransferase|uniref:class I SAM-dependent methyltransferase n=1 Tax=Methanoregula sp. TaxID=2052170 RepID=UPI003D09825A